MPLSKITNESLTANTVDSNKIAADAIGTAELANNVAISTSGAITTTGAFTSPGIDDNGDATTISIDANEDITAANGMYVSGDLTSLTVDKGGIDRSGNTTRIISGRSGGNYADFSVNIAGVGGVNRQLYMDYQGNMTLDNGNLKIGTAGRGIDFSAVTNATGDGTENPSVSSELLDHYENPKNVGSMDKESEEVGTGLVGAPACGDVMKLQIKVNKKGVIEDAKFKTFGCGSAIASSSLITEWVKGKNLDEAHSIKNTEIANHLALPPVKIHCSILAEDAIKAAIEDYKKKNRKNR